MSAWDTGELSGEDEGFDYFSEDDVDEVDDREEEITAIRGDRGLGPGASPNDGSLDENSDDESGAEDFLHSDADDEEDDDELTLPSTATIEDAMENPSTRDALFGISVDKLKKTRRSRKRSRYNSRVTSASVGLENSNANVHPRAINLPRHLEHSMGNANLAYVHRNFSEAIELLKAVIKEAPWVVSPYHTLGLIHQELGDERKALDFFMIASHKNPGDTELWKRNATSFFNIGDIDRSLYCLTKGFASSNRKDLDFLRARAALYKDHRNHSTLAGNNYFLIYKSCPEEYETAQTAAECYIRAEEPSRAINVLTLAIENLTKATSEQEGDGLIKLDALQQKYWLRFLGMLSALYMEQGQYPETSLLLSRSRLQAESIGMQLPANLNIRAHVAKLWQTPDSDELTIKITDGLLQLSPSVVPSAFREAVDCFMGTSNFGEALQLTEAMIDGEEFAEDITTRNVKGACLYSLGRLGDAISEFELVLDLEPDNSTALQALDAIRDSKEAPASVLGARFSSTEPGGEKSKRVAERCEAKIQSRKSAQTLLRSMLPKKKGMFLQGDLQGFYDSFGPLFSLAAVKFRSFAPVNVLDDASQPVTVSAASVFNAFHSELDEASFTEAMDMYWVASFQCGNRKKAYDEIYALCRGKRIAEEHHAFRIRMTLLCSGLGAGKPSVVVRHCQRDWGNELAGPELIYALWKAMEQIDGTPDLHRLQRTFTFMTRKYWSNPSYRSIVLNGEGCAAGILFNRTALQRYMQACKLKPDEPMLYLLTGLETMVHAMGRCCSNRHLEVLQSTALMSMYREKRLGESVFELTSGLSLQERALHAEVSYNIARVFHYAGLKHVAVPLYRDTLKVLVGPTPGLDIRREAAFNLSRIFIESGSTELANAVMRQYLTVW